MKLICAALLALVVTAVQAADTSSTKEPVCDAYLNLEDLKREPGGVSSVNFNGSLCVSAKEFSSVAVGDSDSWRIISLDERFFVMTPSKPVWSLAVLFEPGQNTGHAVLISAKPATPH